MNDVPHSLTKYLKVSQYDYKIVQLTTLNDYEKMLTSTTGYLKNYVKNGIFYRKSQKRN